jgi:NAD(P)H dehydrogenase (quinone)
LAFGGARKGGFAASGAAQPPPNVEANYAASMIEWARQTYDGRMDFGAVTTPAVEELLGRKPLNLRTWVERNRQAVLEAGAPAPVADGTPSIH